MEHLQDLRHPSVRSYPTHISRGLLLVIGPGCDHVQTLGGIHEGAAKAGLQIEVVGDGRQQVRPGDIETAYLKLPQHSTIVITARGLRNQGTHSIELSDANAWSTSSTSAVPDNGHVNTHEVLRKLLPYGPRFIVLTAGGLEEFAQELPPNIATEQILLLDGGPEAQWNTGEGRTKMITQCIINDLGTHTLAEYLLLSPYDLNVLVPNNGLWDSYFSVAPKNKVNDYFYQRCATSGMNVLADKKKLEDHVDVPLTRDRSIALAKVLIHRLAVTDQDAQINLWVGILKRLDPKIVDFSTLGSASPLSIAIASGSMAAAKLLLDNKINLNHQSHNFDTPLLAAIRNSKTVLADALLDEPGIDVSLGAAGQRPLTLAIELGEDVVVTKLLARKDILPSLDQNAALRAAIDRSVYQAVTQLILHPLTDLTEKIPLLECVLLKNNLKLVKAVIAGRRLKLVEAERNSLVLKLKDKNIRGDCIDALKQLL